MLLILFNQGTPIVVPVVVPPEKRVGLREELGSTGGYLVPTEYLGHKSPQRHFNPTHATEPPNLHGELDRLATRKRRRREEELLLSRP